MKRVRLWLRLARLAVVLLLGLALASFVAVVERAYRHDLMALRQRLTAWFLRRLSRALPFDVEVRGELPQGPHLWVGNHVSWTDIPLLGQLLPISFLSKAEVRTWPLAGWLAHKAGTLFIRRGSGDSTLLARQLHRHLEAGRQLLIFPEGTTTDGQQVRTFHGRLLTGAIEAGVPLQPVAIRSAVLAGERDFAKLEKAAVAELDGAGWQTDYVAVRRQSDLQPPTGNERALVVLAASRLGTPRLIDNLEIDLP